MIQYPITFQATAQAEAGIQSLWTVASQNIQAHCAIPPEFEGPGGAVSPEDLFAQALTNCFVATFKVMAEKSRIGFSHVDVQSNLVVDLGESGHPLMKSCKLEVTITGCDNVGRAQTIAKKAFSSGFIINSVRTEMSMELHFA
jgi:organic hydroperoxide reductase OsmC/OhrA